MAQTTFLSHMLFRRAGGRSICKNQPQQEYHTACFAVKQPNCCFFAEIGEFTTETSRKDGAEALFYQKKQYFQKFLGAEAKKSFTFSFRCAILFNTSKSTV